MFYKHLIIHVFIIMLLYSYALVDLKTISDFIGT